TLGATRASCSRGDFSADGPRIGIPNITPRRGQTRMNKRQDMQDTPRSRRLVPVLLWLGWSILLAVWTFGLLSGAPPQVAKATMSEETAHYVGKSVHIGVYALLACLACWLSARWGVRVAAWLG